ncbi:MAG: hypothetical protein UY50_C0027G0014 [Parcubacteria group bacterium GW2011_GWA2_49_9]|nr:MAG: hypothetical protein UY50_C0027G0014 [Parcubacteria group bacterium GW2011_GWA2_49_9]
MRIQFFLDSRFLGNDKRERDEKTTTPQSPSYRSYTPFALSEDGALKVLRSSTYSLLTLERRGGRKKPCYNLCVMTDAETTKIVLFKGARVRKTLHHGEWWFSVVDAVAVLTDQSDDLTARKYWNKLAQRLREEGSELVTFCHQLKLEASDGKNYETDCATTEGLFRIVQSIPSPKAEPFKRWLAKVGYERVQEIENPELATKRTRMLYKLKGYSEDWIEKRMRGIVIREELTDEWKNRGARDRQDYEILTAEISKAC